MTIAQRLATVSANIETATRADEFVQAAKLLLIARGDVMHAAALAERARQNSLATLFKSAVTAGGLTNWDAIAGYPAVATAFLESLWSISAFDRMFRSMRQAPLRTRLAIVTAAVTGATVAEASAKRISSLALDGATLDVLKALALVVTTDELLTAAGSAGNTLFANELRKAVGAATDATFLAEITSGLSPITSSGSTPAAIRQDLGAALAEIDVDAGSKIFILIDGGLARQWAVTANDGDRFLQNMTLNGGTIAGMTVVVTDAVAHQTIVVADANAIAAGSEIVTLDVARATTLQMDDAPDSPPTASTVLHSLFQHGKTALRAERSFGVERLRTNAVALIDGVSSI
jgi:hypothetical protein